MIYVDSVFNVYNITSVNWNVEISKGIVAIVSKNLEIQADNILLSSVVDVSTNSTFGINFSIRYIVDEKDRDNLKKSIPEFYEKFDSLLKKCYRSDFKTISIELEEGPIYHKHKEYLVGSLITVICVLLIVICILIFKVIPKKKEGILDNQ